MKQVIEIPGIKKSTTGFNHVVKAGNFLFLSSQLSTDLITGEILPGDIKTQTKRAMDNIQFLLSKCGASMNDIVRIIIYFRNPTDRKEINEVYRQYFTSGNEPAKTSIQASLPIKGIDIEIEATACINL